MSAQLPMRLPYEMMQQKWASLLNPILLNPLNSIGIIENYKLNAGVNIINHMLGQLPQGWFLVDKQGPGDIYRTAPYTDIQLTLTSTTAVVVSIGVF